MIRKKSYDLAMKFRDADLWDTYSDCDMFAVAFPDGRTGYCMIMGNAGEHYALSVYFDEEGINSLWQMNSDDYRGSPTPDQSFTMHSQICLQVEYDVPSNLSPQSRMQVEKYLKKTGETLISTEIYPSFFSWKTRRVPFEVNSSEQDDLCYVMEAALYLSRHTDLIPERNDFMPWNEDIPLFVKEGRKWNVETVFLPEIMYYTLLKPELPETALIDFLKRLKPHSSMNIDASLFVLSQTVIESNDPGDPAPYFPVMLAGLCQDLLMRPMLSPAISQSDINALLAQFAEQIADLGNRPEKIRVNGFYAYAFLEEFCKASNITLELANELPDLEEAVDEMTAAMAQPDRQFEELMEKIQEAPDSEEILRGLDEAYASGEGREYMMKLMERFYGRQE